MVKHIVMWKLKDNYAGKSKLDNAKIIKNELEGLKKSIKEINFIEVGINIGDDKSSYDIVLYSEFKNRVDLEKYLNHPEHLKVSDKVSSLRLDRIVVDY